MAVIFGLLAASFYGAADFFGGLTTRRSPIFAVTVISQSAGLVFLLAFLPFFHAHPSARDFEWGLLSGIFGGLGIALLYHALSIGKMGVVSPITAVVAAVLPVVTGILRGEHLSGWKTCGIAVALVAVVLISISTEPDGRIEISTAGVKAAILSGIGLGGFYVFLGFAGSGAGLYPLVSARAASIGFLLVAALLARRSLLPAPATLPITILVGSLDMAGNGLYLLAVYAGYLSIAAVLTSLYPASTVFLARFVLGERLAGVQKIGVAFALAGIALIAG